MKSNSHWSVRLGTLEWARHTYARPEGDRLELLGSARHGLQVGALAKLEGAFVLVVGDHVTTLSHADSKELATATAHARKVDKPFVFQPAPAQVAPPVVVVIKRRRIPVSH